MDSMKRQKKKKKDMITEHEPFRLESVHYSTGEEQRDITNSSSKMGWLGHSKNDAQLWMCHMVKVKSDAVKNSII